MLLNFKRNSYKALFRAQHGKLSRAQRGISFIFMFFFIANITFAQTDPLTKKVTSLVAHKEPIESVLSSITKQTNVRFSYNSQLIDPKIMVSVNAQNNTVREILTIILPPYISYKKIGEHIVFVAEEQKIRKTEYRDLNGDTYTVRNDEEKSSSNNGNLPDSCLESVNLTKNDEMKTLMTELLIAAAMVTTPVLADGTLQATSYALQGKENLITPAEEGNLQISNFITSIEEKDSILVDDISAPLVVKPIQLTFFYPLGTGWVKSDCNNYYVSLNILGGVTGATMALDLGGLFNINTSGAKGVQFAGLFNSTGSQCSDIQSKNVQFAGLFNFTKKGKSAQFGGVFNIGDMVWVQASGLNNIAKSAWMQFSGLFNIGKTAYLQAGGTFNIAQKAGVQFSGIFNIANDKSGAQFAGISNIGCNSPFQAAGIANVACNTAFQTAGIVNIAEKSACQIAGILNITKKGKFQMGMINVRDTADGISLGLINIVKKGGVLEAGIEAGEFVHTALTFRSGVQRLYSIISAGYNFTEKFWSVGSGLGSSFKLAENLSLNLELTHAQLYANSLKSSQWKSLTQFIPVLNYRFAKHFKIYAGPSLNLLIQDYGSDDYRVKAPYSIYHKEYSTSHLGNRNTIDLWIGVVGGIKF
ncbi:MAG: hypothetical protein LBI45_06830 [Bacteroidales bacterium]|jgi:hypothetical protein|nr:hypothetical protein [Bacteroidales bacterium]